MDRRPWHASYDDGVPTSVAYEELTLPGYLARAGVASGDRPAIHFLNARLSYRELDEAARRFACALTDLGLRAGDRVAIQLPNLPQTVIAFYGTLRAGGVVVMTNPLYTSREIEHQWNDAGCRFAVTTDFLYDKSVAPIRSKVPVEKYVIASIPEYLRFPLNLLAPLKLKREGLIARVPEATDVFHFRKLVDRASTDPAGPGPALDDLAALQYTGGTTGVSKGAMLSHRNLSFQTQQLHAWLPEIRPGEDVFLAALPFFHVFGLTVAMSLPVKAAACMALLPNPRDIAQMIHAINTTGVTVFPVVPAMVHGINHHPKAETLHVEGFKICVSGSAPMPEDTLRRFEEITGGKIVEGYGLTEASPVTHVNPNRGKRKVNTIGLPIPDTDCRILAMASDQAEVAPGEEGELCIRGPQVMQGYWNRPEDTAESLEDGWLHTGDLAAMDEEGYFRIVGRIKDLIVCSGYNVYPDEIDRVLTSHAEVLECATIGVPDEKRGESVKSFVVRQPGATVTAEALTAFCRENLAPFKIPREIEFREDLPKSSVLKILRRELLDEELRHRRESRQLD
jgi:long-chain acyl-CoA synthetase